MNYWHSLPEDINNPEVNMSFDLIREAIDELETNTKHRIKGSLSKIEYTKTGYRVAINSLQGLFNLSQGLFKDVSAESVESHNVEKIDENFEGKEDINDFHELELYKFEIYTEKYHFRIFQVVNSIAFPVRIVVDEGIANELQMKSPGYEITSNTEMKNFLQKILGTNKVRNVVNQLLVLAEAEKDDRIENYLKSGKKATVSEIAKNIGWSKALTTEKLYNLEERGLVHKIESDGKKAQVWEWIGSR